MINDLIFAHAGETADAKGQNFRGQIIDFEGSMLCCGGKIYTVFGRVRNGEYTGSGVVFDSINS